MEYFFASGNEQRGPHSLDELISFGLRPDTLVWREGMAQWQRADAVPEVAERMRAGDPLPVELAPVEAPTVEAPPVEPQAPVELRSEALEPAAAVIWSDPAMHAPAAGLISSGSALRAPAADESLPPAALSYHSTAHAPPANGMAIASMILGILSIPMMCAWFLGIVCAILAIVFGFIARSKVRSGDGGGGAMALAGIICGFVSIGLLLVGIAIIVVLAIVG